MIFSVVVFAILRVVSLKDVEASENPLFDRIPTVTWTQTALAYSIATATIPSLVGFILALNSGFGTFSADLVREQTMQDSRSKSVSGDRMELRSMNRSQKSRQMSDVRVRGQHLCRHGEGADRACLQGRVDTSNYKWAINSRQQAEERSIASDDSQNMIIRKTVEFTTSAEKR